MSINQLKEMSINQLSSCCLAHFPGLYVVFLIASSTKQLAELQVGVPLLHPRSWSKGFFVTGDGTNCRTVLGCVSNTNPYDRVQETKGPGSSTKMHVPLWNTPFKPFFHPKTHTPKAKGPKHTHLRRLLRGA